MKKILFAATFIAISFIAYSQGVQLGVCLNPHFAWFTENSSKMKSNGTRMGLEGGLVMENYFSKNYAFVTGIRLGTFGGKMEYNDSITFQTNDGNKYVLPEEEVKYKMQFISVPAALKLKTNQIGYFSYYAQLGFTGMINIGAKADNPPRIDNDGAGKEVGPLSVAYHFGGGMEYEVGGNTAIVVGIIYNNGFIDLLTKQEGRESLSFLAINLGVMF
ncbi:MAG TPA: porin family protein [Bacteroidales bacterium]|nr:porin family protein [Bacteroidales bacterium]